MQDTIHSQKVEPHAAYKWLFGELDPAFDEQSLSWKATVSLFDAMSNANTAKEVSPQIVAALKAENLSPIYSVYTKDGAETNPASLIVLDETNQLLQIRKWFEYEKAVAASLANRVGTTLDIDLEILPKIRKFLDSVLINRKEAAFPPLQKIAVLQALKNRFTVITGGPGTGKTYTVSALIIAALLQAQYQNKTLRISLCAPTGKAAARMNESINAAFLNFKEQGLLEQLSVPEIKAQTIHSLIGYDGFYDKTYKDEVGFVEADLLLVDEASMIDLPLMHHLLKAVPKACSMVLLGDPDQLSSVESGAVLANICDNGADNTFDDETLVWLNTHFGIEHPNLKSSSDLSEKSGTKVKSVQSSLFDEADSEKTKEPVFKNQIIRLLDSHRFRGDTQMGQLVELIRTKALPTKQWKLIEGANDNSLLGIVSTDALTDKLMVILEKRLARLNIISSVTISDKVEEELDKVKQIFALVNEMALLSPTHHDELGVDSLNSWFEANAKKVLDFKYRQSAHYPGRLIIIKQNDSSSGLFNGDIGVAILAGNGQIQYLFEDLEKGVKKCLPALLPNHKSAYVLTVHKSQGSEYKEVVLLLPSFNDKTKKTSKIRLVNRELLYTAITRAKEKVVIVGQKGLWEARANISTTRESGLSYRLKENGQFN